MSDDELAKIEMEAEYRRPHSDYWSTIELIAEVRRLKAGEFTEEEFQRLCHKFSGDDACRFAQGCLEYNCKLFGAKQMLELKK